MCKWQWHTYEIRMFPSSSRDNQPVVLPKFSGRRVSMSLRESVSLGHRDTLSSSRYLSERKFIFRNTFRSVMENWCAASHPYFSHARSNSRVHESRQFLLPYYAPLKTHPLQPRAHRRINHTQSRSAFRRKFSVNTQDLRHENSQKKKRRQIKNFIEINFNARLRRRDDARSRCLQLQRSIRRKIRVEK